MSKTMKAALYDRYGSPDVVKVQEVNQPVPKEDEVLIKVHCSTVNRTDCGFRSAEYVISRLFSGILKPKFPILGNEFAGEIVGLGAQVNQFKLRDRVFGYNDQQFGGHAEYMVMNQNHTLSTIPDGLTYAEAAPSLEGSHYALCDIYAAKVKAGQSVLVNGATGAIGSAAVQLLKYFGAKVTAVCATPHLALVKSLGADRVIDYNNEDFTLQSETYDFIFDAVGKSSYGRCKPLLKEQGIYISTELGKRGENIYLALWTRFSKGKKLLFPIPVFTRKDLQFLKDRLTDKSFKPVVDSVFTLDQIVDAHRYVETGQKIGNVLIQIATD